MRRFKWERKIRNMEGSCSFKRVVREVSLRQWYKKEKLKEMREVAMWMSRKIYA